MALAMRLFLIATLFAFGSMASPVAGQTVDSELPVIKFFYFDHGSVEWTVSAESEEFQKHLSENESSSTLMASLINAVNLDVDAETMRPQIAEWIANQREGFEQRNIRPQAFRRAEGIVAYLRAHDFNISQLVSALKRRSGAANVQIVAVHQVKDQDKSSFMLKVVLDEPEVDLGRMGYNVELGSAQTGYITVIYALGLALYEVHERINEGVPADDESTEELPAPAGQ